MLAGVKTSGHERSIEIVRRLHDPSAEECIATFEKVFPRLTRERAVWAHLFAIGARAQHARSTEEA
ncbi:hypothetical protein [Methylobacterium sp. WSM2598]|uniref:hypothetical protein n=1 Tax=Methylobacterium sp. WSM2598 TaxID=398261 RepID=UPI00038233E8|nr:hypothetical protein [Methylobacterium sp. WSM2598]